MYTFNKPLHLSPYDHPDIYPGPTPPYSFIYMNGTAYRLTGSGNPSSLKLNYKGQKLKIAEFLKDHNVSPLEERYPVLSYGSNVCLAQLKYKYNLKPTLNDIVINLKGDLRDTDVIYAAYITRYGALPAMLGPMKKAKCQVWLTFYDEEQLKLISSTESVYSLATHHGKKLFLDCGIRPAEFYAYYFERALTLDGSYFRYPDIPSKGSTAKGIWQAHMLQLLAAQFGLDRENFIDLVRNNVEFRRSVQKALDLLSVPVKHEDWSVIKKIKKWKDISQ